MHFEIKFIVAAGDNNLLCTAKSIKADWPEELQEALKLVNKCQGQLVSIERTDIVPPTPTGS